MNFSIFMLFIIFGNSLGIQLQTDNHKKYCFKFTWPGSLKESKDEINCTVLENMKIPCTYPIKYDFEVPSNFTGMWETRDETEESTNNKIYCSLEKGYSCIKYTYSFDNAVTNATYFCGKMIKNKETAIQSGCFTQKVGGYDVEACACQSTGYGNGIPCNSSTKLNYSLGVLVLFLLLLSSIQN